MQTSSNQGIGQPSDGLSSTHKETQSNTQEYYGRRRGTNSPGGRSAAQHDSRKGRRRGKAPVSAAVKAARTRRVLEINRVHLERCEGDILAKVKELKELKLLTASLNPWLPDDDYNHVGTSSSHSSSPSSSGSSGASSSSPSASSSGDTLLGSAFRSEGSMFEAWEFYGDAVLQERISRFLMTSRRFLSPHLLTQMRMSCTSNRTLAMCFDALGIESVLQPVPEGFSDELTIKRKGDVVEAMLGELGDHLIQVSDSKTSVSKIETLMDQLLAYISYVGEQRYFLRGASLLEQATVQPGNSSSSRGSSGRGSPVEEEDNDAQATTDGGDGDDDVELPRSSSSKRGDRKKRKGGKKQKRSKSRNGRGRRSSRKGRSGSDNDGDEAEEEEEEEEAGATSSSSTSSSGSSRSSKDVDSSSTRRLTRMERASAKALALSALVSESHTKQQQEMVDTMDTGSPASSVNTSTSSTTSSVWDVSPSSAAFSTTTTSPGEWRPVFNTRMFAVNDGYNANMGRARDSIPSPENMRAMVRNALLQEGLYGF